MTTTLTAQTQVLIIGAGPTGLTLATVLAKYGVQVRIIEKKDALSRHTKATNLMQRNQEVLYALGLLEPLNDISGFYRRLMIHAYGTSPLSGSAPARWPPIRNPGRNGPFSRSMPASNALPRIRSCSPICVMRRARSTSISAMPASACTSQSRPSVS